MIKMLNINVDKCTGCGACVSKCPKQCIYWIEKELGFFYPQIEEAKCINCGLCEKACPIDKEFRCETQKAYAVVNCDKKVVNQSTSGGMFTAVADYVLEKKGLVYGCAYDNELNPLHIRIENKIELEKLRGSKYVQSNTNSTYMYVKEDLDSDKYVLFTGTPCQVAGLKFFLSKEYDKLITIDLVCHGVSSAKYFKDYIEYLDKKLKAKITKFSFRNKNNKGWSLSGTYSGTYSGSGKHFEKKLAYFNSYYYYYFLKSETYRESCYQCKYANLTRIGDFTLGDFWGAERLKLNLKIDNGCSAVLVNSNKALKIFDLLDIRKIEVSIEELAKENNQLKTPSSKPKSREIRINEYKEKSIEYIDKNYKKTYRKQIFFGKIKYCIPKKISRIIAKIKSK